MTRRILWIVVIGVALNWKCGALAETKSFDVFTRRILPILNSATPSSCAECHLSGVDLKDYIRPNQAETFAALVKGGMIDAQHPLKSKLLEFISRRRSRPLCQLTCVRKNWPRLPPRP